MPYHPIPLHAHVNQDVVDVVRGTIEHALREFHFLLTVHMPNGESNGSLQSPLAILLLSMIDGCAQLLYPGEMRDGERFKSFLMDNYPWHLDMPQRITPKDVCEILWKDMRCPMLHRFGLSSKAALQTKIRYGRTFCIGDDDITNIEQYINESPYDEPSVNKTENYINLKIETFYWGLRLAIKKSLDDKDKSDKVFEWLKSGKWDHKKKITNENPLN